MDSKFAAYLTACFIIGLITPMGPQLVLAVVAVGLMAYSRS